MIVGLGWQPEARVADGRTVRAIAFVRRSTLPLSAACLVANGVREQLSRLLASELEVELAEPAVPGPAECRLLVEGAIVFRVRGRICDGFIIIRPADARRLAALAFGESERASGAPLSDIERVTLERIVAALAPLCNTLCGTLGPVTRETSERAALDLQSYFEVRTTGSPALAIGFALARDPIEEVAPQMSLDDLADVELEATVEVGSGMLGIPAFSRLAAGETVVLDTRLGALGVLRFGGVAFGRGTCGVANGRSAISFEYGAESGAA